MEILKQLSDWSWVTLSAAWISLLTLVVLEVVLGVDNIVFISILTGKLAPEKRAAARRRGLVLAVIPRLVFLLLLGLILGMQKPLFSIPWPFEQGVDPHPDAAHPVPEGYLALTGQDLVLLAGGLFLILQAVREIHHKLEGEDPNAASRNKKPISLLQAIGQIMLIDAVFSFDSIITAGGTAKHVEIMIAAVIIAMIVMFVFSPKISSFIHKHPTLKMLALSFLVMIGLSLIIEGWDSEAAHQLHLKNYIYFGMAFSFIVELLNMVMRKRMAKNRVVQLNEPVLDDEKNQSDQAH